MAQKLWEKNVQVDHEVDVFTVGKDREMDLYLAKYDVLGSMAHITMLESIGLLSKEELDVLLAELRKIYAIADKGEFVIEDGIEGLRYNRVIVATDADVDGMHIRLLMITFFLQFFPELIKKGHVYILQTPLFRVRNVKRGKTVYCYSDAERAKAIDELSPNAEITRFKGLGEISPEEFTHFIGPDMRLDQVMMRKTDAVGDLLGYYMGDNTRERQDFIIENLVVEEDKVV